MHHLFVAKPYAQVTLVFCAPQAPDWDVSQTGVLPNQSWLFGVIDHTYRYNTTWIQLTYGMGNICGRLVPRDTKVDDPDYWVVEVGDVKWLISGFDRYEDDRDLITDYLSSFDASQLLEELK